jgi:uncharacterized protein
MHSAVIVMGGIIMALGLACAILPAVPGIPLIFGGVWMIAAQDGYRHLGLYWLVSIAVVGALGVTLDLLAGALGAKRVGASARAVWGALLGTVIGLFLGIPGLIFGPFLGALLGELSAGNSVLRSAHVGVGTWLGLIFGTLVKLVTSLMMVALFVTAWWWNRLP